VGNSTVHPPVTMRLPCTASSVPVARQQLKHWMSGLGGSGERIEDARVVISELLGNAVRHASPLDDGSIVVTWGLDRGGVSLAVTDGGGDTGPRRVDTPSSALTGRGLAIVDALAQEWWLEQTPTRSTVHALLDV
jgi:serine/threonine-protein kinase RsbW